MDQNNNHWVEAEFSQINCNDKINENNITAPHIKETINRISKYPLILAIQDTTVINHTSHIKTKGLGTIGKHPSGKVKLQGLLMHSCLALTTDGLPLGLISNQIRTRKNVKNTGEDYKKMPIEDKESYKWIEALENVNQRVDDKTNVLTICDRESDIYDFFLEAKSLEEHVLVRASHDRCISIMEKKGRLFEHISNEPSLGITQVEVPYKVITDIPKSGSKFAKGKKTRKSPVPDGKRQELLMPR